MCIRIVFGHTDEQITEAQWAVVNALRRAVDRSLVHGNARQTLRDVFARTHAASAEQWVAEVAEALVEIIAQIQAAASHDAHEVQRLRLECDTLRRIVAGYNAHPLQAQVEALTQERDRCHGEAERLANQVQSLEDALRRARQAHQVEVTQLQAEIAALNRIVVGQQEALNECNS